MKKLMVFWILVFVFISFLTLGQNAFAQEGLTKIADNVYAYVDIKGSSPANSFGANAGIIIGKGGIVVIDTLISAKEAQRFISDIRKISDKPIKYVVNTHVHLDHTFGNSEFDKIGSVIISHDATKNAMKGYGDFVMNNLGMYGFTAQEMEGTKVACPSLTFSNRKEIDLGDRIVELIYPGPSHTDGSILVYLRKEKILFAGDALFTNYVPNLRDGDIDTWVKTLDFIAGMDADKIIPGHGPVSNKQDVTDMKNYLITFDKKARELAAVSKDVQYIVSELKKTLPARPELEFLISANVQSKYLKK